MAVATILFGREVQHIVPTTTSRSASEIAACAELDLYNSLRVALVKKQHVWAHGRTTLATSRHFL